MITIPVTIVTGFLGSGKTTLLNRLLREANLVDTLVIVNEFGEIGIDHLLVEQASEGIIELSDGCLCCSLRGDLLDSLIEVLEKMACYGGKKISRIMIETTGIADPIPILQLIMAHPMLVHALHVENVITVIDAANGMHTLEHYHEAVKQVAVADCLVLTKTELAREEDNKTLRDYVRGLNPNAAIFVSDDGQSFFDCLLEDRLSQFDIAAHQRDQHHAHDHSHHHHHGEGILSFSLTHCQPVPASYWDIFIDLLRANYGKKILRMKGIVLTVEKADQPLVIHGAQGLFHPAFRLKAWRDDSRFSRLVVIADGVERQEILSLFDAITNRPMIDRPDLTALTNNPLAIAGIKL